MARVDSAEDWQKWSRRRIVDTCDFVNDVQILTVTWSAHIGTIIGLQVEGQFRLMKSGNFTIFIIFYLNMR
jgi:hypothetical protein